MAFQTHARGELDPLVGQYQHEVHRKRAAEALKSLQKIASIVKPIMRQRNWFVGTLCEFYPDDTRLLGLNVNRGQKILLRLRYPGDENQFLPLEQVIDTMLHELSHIVHGDHDKDFNALWDQLRDEHQALVLKGYTGEGFLGRGERLGGQRIPMNEARRRARAAAEKRRTLTAGGGQKLGGRPIMKGENVRNVIVNAIEQRNRIQQGCASGTEKGLQIAIDAENDKPGVATTKAEHDDANEASMMQAYIEMIQQEEKEKHGDDYIPPSQSNPAGMRSLTIPPISPRLLRAQQASIEQSLRKSELPPAIPTDTKSTRAVEQSLKPTKNTTLSSALPLDTWTCEICTLVNLMDHLQCDACEVERPMKYAEPPPMKPRTSSSKPSSSTPNALKPRLKVAEALAKFDAEGAYKQSKPITWRCHSCGTYVEADWWTCVSCGTMKTSS